MLSLFPHMLARSRGPSGGLKSLGRLWSHRRGRAWVSGQQFVIGAQAPTLIALCWVEKNVFIMFSHLGFRACLLKYQALFNLSNTECKQ